MLITLLEGLRIFKRNIKVKLFGFEKFIGTDEEICKKIIDECWNGIYFSTTPKGGNYSFYSRDFGWCIDSLINLGYKKEVNKTLEYVMNVFEKNNGIYVSINSRGKPFNFPNKYSPDSVAYIFRSLRINKNKKLILRYRKFLNKEAKKFREICLTNEGMIKKEHFSGMRDYAIIKGSCYDMIMACMLDDEINKINRIFNREIIKNPFKSFNLKKILIENFWKDGFYEVTNNEFYGHNNVYPFFLQTFKNKKMLKKSLLLIQRKSLNNPIPLKYESENSKTKFIWQDMFVSGWEKKTCWTMLGMAYIDILSSIDKNKAKKHIMQYKELIEKNGFVEVYDELKPYSSFFYSSETKMLWASMYLYLKKKLYKN